jgi:hypothetical protein
MDKQKRKRYNPDWSAVSCNIRVHRAKNHCEVCGIENLLIIKRAKNGSWRVATDDELRLIQWYKDQLHWKEQRILKTLLLTKIILTVAHIDHNEHNDNPTNLLCLCQKCHFTHDRKDNWIRRKRHRPPDYPHNTELYCPIRIE